MVTPIAPAPLPGDVSSEALLRTLLAIAPLGIVLLRPLYADADAARISDFALVQLNPAAQQLLGGLPECPTESFLTLFPTAQGTDGFAFYCQAFRSGQVERHQQLYQADGVDGYYQLVAQRQGPLLVVSFTDTNDQSRSAVEEALRQSQAREQQARAEAERQARTVRETMHHFFDQAPVGVSMVRGSQLIVEMVNEAAATLLGSTQAALLGQPLLEVLVQLPGQGLEALFQRVLQGETFVFDELPVTVDRTHLGQPNRGYYRVIYQPWRDGGAEIIGMITIAVEVTDQVLARQQVQNLNQELEGRVQERTHQLTQQQQQLQAIFEQAPVAIFVLRGTEYVFEVVNPSMGQMLATAPDQIRGRRYFDLLPALEAQGYRQLLDQVWSSGQAYVAQEQAAQLPHHGEGEMGYYNFTYVPLREVDGRVSGIMCVAVDVTAQVLARQQVQRLNQDLAATNGALTATNAELHAANTQLTRTNVDLDTFVYTASHDLKAPITNIESIALALRSALPAEVQQDELVAHLLDLLGQTVARFQFTIGQLTDLSKLQLAHAGPAEPVNLAAIIESVRLDLAPAIAAAEAQLTVEIAPDLLVSFSPANLRSAIYNLLSNAVKYRALDRPAQVRVRAYPAAGRVALEVQDNGLGLSAHQQSRLFGLFQRLHTHVEGTGVGLYITKRLVENGGGTIAVTSQLNVGTTFALTFPV